MPSRAHAETSRRFRRGNRGRFRRGNRGRFRRGNRSGTITRIGPASDVFSMTDLAGDQWNFRLARTGQVLLPRSAQLMHRMAVIRSLSHGNANHVQAALTAMTGHVHPPGTESRGDIPPASSDFPLTSRRLGRC